MKEDPFYNFDEKIDPLYDFYEKIDGYTHIPATTAAGAIVITVILSAILAKISTTVAAKPIEQERANNHGTEGKNLQNCNGQPSENHAESSSLVAHHGEEQTQI